MKLSELTGMREQVVGYHKQDINVYAMNLEELRASHHEMRNNMARVAGWLDAMVNIETRNIEIEVTE